MSSMAKIEQSIKEMNDNLTEKIETINTNLFEPDKGAFRRITDNKNAIENLEKTQKKISRFGWSTLIAALAALFGVLINIIFFAK